MTDLLAGYLSFALTCFFGLAGAICGYLTYGYPRWNQPCILGTIADLQPASEYEITTQIRNTKRISAHRLLATDRTLRVLTQKKLISYQDRAYTSLLGPTIQRQYSITETGRQYLQTHHLTQG